MTLWRVGPPTPVPGVGPALEQARNRLPASPVRSVSLVVDYLRHIRAPDPPDDGGSWTPSQTTAHSSKPWPYLGRF